FVMMKFDARIITPKESLVFGALQLLSIVPGIPRPAVFMSVGKFMGVEKKQLAKIMFISLIPVLMLDLFFVTGVFPLQILSVLYDSWLLSLILFVLLIPALDVVFYITSSRGYYKFYYYLFAVGAWTILDMIFSKRGL